MPRKRPQVLGGDLNKPLSGGKSRISRLQANGRLTVVAGGEAGTLDDLLAKVWAMLDAIIG